MKQHACSRCAKHSIKNVDGNSYRLPRTVVPHRYDLAITADPSSTHFSGTVAIEATVLEPSAVIVINAKELVIARAIARHANGTALNGTVCLNVETEMAHISFDGVLAASEWTFDFDFLGKHGEASAGFFRSTYKNNEVEKHMLCTQFESADARSAFPCFDEPEYKATFKVRLNVPEEMTALSNGDILSATTLGDGRKLVEFEETEKISSYLVCFTVGELVATKPVTVNGKRLTVWCVPGQEEFTGLAEKVGAFGLRFFEEYFDISCPFGNKLDFVAVPGFAWGGMENPGLIIFQENCMLAAPAAEEWSQTQAVIIFHELAHQWFGNLVTPRWWNGLWLNESFATFMSYVAAEAWAPHWKTWDQFGSKRDLAYTHDSLRNSHPIEQNIDKPGNATYLVDPISYEKGCSIMYQTASFIGADVFRDGIRRYLKQHEFGNTESGDLWHSLEQACHAAELKLPITEIMKAWVFQTGHPEVLVSADKDGYIRLSQRPFLLLEKGRRSKKLWPIPIIVQVKQSDGTICADKILFSRRHQRLYVGRDCQWVKINAGGTGFFRVHYDATLFAKLTANMLELSDIEQFNLLNDGKSFFKACLISAAEYVDLIFKFAQVNDEGSWLAINEGMEKLVRLVPQKQYRRLIKAVGKLLRHVGQSHGWNPAGDQVLPFLASWKPYHLNLNPDVQKLSRKFLRDWRRDQHSVDETMAAQAAMILHFGRARMPANFRALQKQAQNTTPLQLQHYLVELCSRLKADGKSVDIYDLFATVMLHLNPSSEHLVTRLVEEWPELIRTGSTIDIMYRVRFGVDEIDEPAQEERLKELFRQHPHEGARAEIKRGLERVRANVVMQETQAESLVAYLATQQHRTKSGGAARAA